MTPTALATAAAAALLSFAPVGLSAQGAGADERAIRDVIETSYVTAVFVSHDAPAVRAGFHPDFVLWVQDDGELLAVSLDAWLEHLELDGRPSGDTVEHAFKRVDVTGDAAVVKLQLYINGEHEYTDYFALYRFADGWKIVTKLFQDYD